MTSSEVRALIDAKIKGQGTNVDAGSVLPVILNGILDLIDEGGGGTSDAVQYVPQDLTESEQMQARKNQGLYYEGIEIAEQDITLSMLSNAPKSYSWKGVLFYFQWDNLTQTPYPAPRTIADVLSFGWNASGQITEMDVVVGENAALVAEGVYVLYGPDADPEIGPSSGVEDYQYCIVAFEGNAESLDAGFYYPSYNEWSPSKYIDSVKYLGETPTIHHIEPKYIEQATEEGNMDVRKRLGLYYEETGIEKLEYDPDGQQVSGGPAFYEEYFIKASDTPIDLDDLGTTMAYIGLDEETEVEITPDKILDESAMGYYCVFQNGEQQGMPIVTVILNDSASPFGATLTKGVWFCLSGSGDYHTLWVEHSATTVHQIPAKYIPDMPSDVLVVTATYSYPNYTLDKTYAEIAEAFNEGKLVILKRTGWILICSTIVGNIAYFSGISYDGKQILLDTIASDDTFTLGQYPVPSTIIISVSGDESAGSGEGNPYYEFALNGGSVSKTINMNVNGVASKESAGMVQNWSVEKLSGDATFTMNSSLGSYSLTVAATTAGISQAIITFQYTVPGLFGDVIRRISAILTIKVTS